MTIESVNAQVQFEESQPAIEVPKDRTGRVRWREFAQDQENFIPFVERESRVFFDQYGVFSKGTLARTGKADLERAISRYYPGGFSSLKETIGANPDVHPPGYWQDTANILEEAKRFVNNSGHISVQALTQNGLSSLSSAIGVYYPNKWRGLRQDLGLDQLRNPNGSWTEERIKREAQTFYEQTGKLTGYSLTRNGQQTLLSAISAHYEGGIVKLRTDISAKSVQRPRNYWTEDNVEAEAAKVIAAEGELSNTTMRGKYQALYTAISKYYPGGLPTLRAKCGLDEVVKPHNYWSATRVEDESKAFLDEFGDVSIPLLEEHGRKDLLSAISRYYPDGFSGLAPVLGIEPKRKRGYWTTELIEQEVSRILSEHGELSTALLRAKGRMGLATAISKIYPGALTALKNKLDTTYIPEFPISPSEANEQLEKLLEESI